MAREPRDTEPLIPKTPAGTQAKQIADLWDVVRVLRRKIKRLEADADKTFDRAAEIKAMRTPPPPMG